MTLQANITLLAQTLGTDVKSILASIGVLSNLATTNKTSLVEAINEVISEAGTSNVTINDNPAQAPTDQVRSAAYILANYVTATQTQSAIDAAVAQAKSDILGGAPAALDTLLEIANELAADQTLLDTLQAASANAVKYTAQTLTAGEQLQARTNIDAQSKTEIGDALLDHYQEYVNAVGTPSASVTSSDSFDIIAQRGSPFGMITTADGNRVIFSVRATSAGAAGLTFYTEVYPLSTIDNGYKSVSEEYMLVSSVSKQDWDTIEAGITFDGTTKVITATSDFYLRVSGLPIELKLSPFKDTSMSAFFTLVAQDTTTLEYTELTTAGTLLRAGSYKVFSHTDIAGAAAANIHTIIMNAVLGVTLTN